MQFWHLSLKVSKWKYIQAILVAVVVTQDWRAALGAPGRTSRALLKALPSMQSSGILIGASNSASDPWSAPSPAASDAAVTRNAAEAAQQLAEATDHAQARADAALPSGSGTKMASSSADSMGNDSSRSAGSLTDSAADSLTDSKADSLTENSSQDAKGGSQRGGGQSDASDKQQPSEALDSKEGNGSQTEGGALTPSPKDAAVEQQISQPDDKGLSADEVDDQQLSDGVDDPEQLSDRDAEGTTQEVEDETLAAEDGDYQQQADIVDEDGVEADTFTQSSGTAAFCKSRVAHVECAYVEY